MSDTRTGEVVLRLDLRDYFAGQAMTAFMTNEAARDRCLEDARARGAMLFDAVAADAYMLADCMLAERQKDRA